LLDNLSVAEAHWIARFKDKAESAPIVLGLFIAVGYLLFRCLFDALFLAIWGIPEGFFPLWQSNLWWSELINAILLGYVPAILVIARRGIVSDLSQLRPWLPCSDAEVDYIRASATGPAGFPGQAFKLSGLIVGGGLVLIDPSLSLGAERSLTNPSFLWPLLRTALFAWVVFTLIVSDFKATRAYLHMGRNLIEVDLLDVQSLSPFARRGLRSALMWVIFSIIFSLFWVGDAASEANLTLLVVVLTMATGAFVVPLVGVHYNILSVKRSELDRLRQKIRVERASIITDASDDEGSSPRLANLIAYYQLIDQAREWPIDAAKLLRFFMYLLIGLGSWMGSAMVERLLDRTLGG
jgi:hypothetical protein